PVRPQRQQRGGQRQQAEQQRDHHAGGQQPGFALACHGRAPSAGGAWAAGVASGGVASLGAASVGIASSGDASAAGDDASAASSGGAGTLRSSSTSRPRSRLAAGRTSPTRNARLSSGFSETIVPTGKPAGNRPPRPEVTSRSPTLMSVDSGMPGRLSISARPLP